MRFARCFILFACALCGASAGSYGGSVRAGAETEPQACQLTVEDIDIARGKLRLVYLVRNGSPYDIWICEDTIHDNKRRRSKGTGGKSVKPKEITDPKNAETRIVDGTLTIRLRNRLECNRTICIPFDERYRRLAPGETYSGEIVCDLPVRNWSPVYSWRPVFSPRVPIRAKRVTLEIGYYTESFARERFPLNIEDIRLSPEEEAQVKARANAAAMVFEAYMSGRPGSREPNTAEYAALEEYEWRMAPAHPVLSDPNAMLLSIVRQDLYDGEQSVSVTVDNAYIPCIAIQTTKTTSDCR